MGSLKKRAAIIDEFYTRMGDTMRTRTTEEWLAGFEEKGIPAAKVNSTADLLEDPHLKETGFFIEQETDRGYGMKFPGMPAFFSHTPGRVDGPARPLGQDSRVILAENGFTEEEIAALERQKALVVPEERSRQ